MNSGMMIRFFGIWPVYTTTLNLNDLVLRVILIFVIMLVLSHYL